MNRNGIQNLAGAFGTQEQGGFRFKPDARHVLKPFLGSEVLVYGYIGRLSRAKGLKSHGTAFLENVEVEVAGQIIEFGYLWLETNAFEAEKDYMFKATVISYVSKSDDYEPSVKYGLGNFRDIVVTGGKRQSAGVYKETIEMAEAEPISIKRVTPPKKKSVKKVSPVAAKKEAISITEVEPINTQVSTPSEIAIALIAIDDLFSRFGYMITPVETSNGKWLGNIFNPSTGKTMTLATKNTFADTVANAERVMSFLCAEDDEDED